MKHTRKTRLRVWVLLVVDCLAAGVLLLAFALAHHVIPRSGEGSGIVIERPSSSVSEGSSASSEDSGEDTAPDTPAWLKGWAKKWPDKFSETPVTTANGYTSAAVSVSVDKVTVGDAVCFVADIYVADVENFRTGLAGGKYGSGYRERIEKQAKENNAVVAVNGDYYGNSAERKGIVIRNGVAYRTTTEGYDVCVLYYDGTMQTYTDAQFSVNDAIQKGAWQAWSFGPALLHGDGTALTNVEIVSQVKPDNPRTAVGYYEPGHYCFVVVDGRQAGYSAGMRLEELGAFMESLGCKQAYNLDGGATSVMALHGEVYNQPYNDGRSCSDILYIGEVQ